MSKIIFSTFSGASHPKFLSCFFQGFINALIREGNDILFISNNEFNENIGYTNNPDPKIDLVAVHAEIIAFNPDLIITCNNSLLAGIPNLVDCPILVWAVDSPTLFWDQTNLRENVGRYHFISLTTDFYPLIKNLFQAKNDQTHLFAYVSDFEPETIEQSIPISFIGSKFEPTTESKQIMLTLLENENIRQDLKSLLANLEENAWVTSKVWLSSFSATSRKVLKKLPRHHLLNILTSNFHSQTLYHIHDLGLHLYGLKTWADFFDFSLPFAYSYQKDSSLSSVERQNLYNRSKIALNLTPMQTKSAVGYYVQDIMATNACLVSDYRKNLVDLFAKYVTIPTFTNPFEARKLCQKLLKDDLWREEIVRGSQLAIKEAHRFEHRLVELEEVFAVNLHPKNKLGTCKKLQAINFIKTANSSEWSLPHQTVKIRKKIIGKYIVAFKILIKILFSILYRTLKKMLYIFIYKIIRRLLPKSIKKKLKSYLKIPETIIIFEKNVQNILVVNYGYDLVYQTLKTLLPTSIKVIIKKYINVPKRYL